MARALRAGQVPAVSATKLEFVCKVLPADLLATAIILLYAAIMACGGRV